MKVHADKIEKGPPHALSVRDIRTIFKTVPRDWTLEIKEVRISNSLEHRQAAFFSRYDGCFTVYSRNGTKEKALGIVLSELAAISMQLDRGLRHRPKAVRDRLAKMTEDLQQRLLPLIAPAQLKTHTRLEGFKELRFPFVPNDIE